MLWQIKCMKTYIWPKIVSVMWRNDPWSFSLKQFTCFRRSDGTTNEVILRIIGENCVYFHVIYVFELQTQLFEHFLRCTLWMMFSNLLPYRPFNDWWCCYWSSRANFKRSVLEIKCWNSKWLPQIRRSGIVPPCSRAKHKMTIFNCMLGFY